ncbi:MAG: response regulator [Acidobacteriota bacterium]|nr:response regulator [Acidobacteriota bacterium]
MAPAKILVIEDSEADLHLLRIALDQQEQDYELETLRDGEEAMRFVHEHRTGLGAHDPCVIVLDVQLPRYDGMAVLRAIHQAPALEHIRVLVLSGLVNPKQQAELASLGVCYRRKPSTLDELSDLAAEIFAICKASSAAIFL